MKRRICFFSKKKPLGKNSTECYRRTDAPIIESRSTAERRIERGNLSEGYRALADWYYSKNSIDNALFYYLEAAKAGDTHSKEVIEYYTHRAKSDGLLSILMAECCYMSGGLDSEADAFFRQANMLGNGAAVPGMVMRNAGNRKKITCEKDINSAMDKFMGRLFKSVIVDYNELDRASRKRCVDLFRGFSYARGAAISFSNENNILTLTHWYKERLLIPINDTVEKIAISVEGEDAGETAAALRGLIEGKTVEMDYRKCTSTSSYESFGLLSGATFGLKGSINRSGDIVSFMPLYKEDNSDSPLVIEN